MTTYDPDDLESQATRRRVLQNDARLRGSTFAQFAMSEAEEVRGRFSATERAAVIGATSTPNYPAAFQQRDPVPDEPALGVSVNALEPTGEQHEIQASITAQDNSFDLESPAGVPPVVTDDPAHAPLGGSGSAPSGALVSERAGSSSSSEQTNE